LGIAVWRKGCNGFTALAIFRRIEKLVVVRLSLEDAIGRKAVESPD
jgi:hypothetical protein